MQESNLKVTIEEANLILEALGNLPFIKVYALVAKIQGQASEQLNTASALGGTEDAEYPAPTVGE
jgi:hypothetical protein